MKFKYEVAEHFTFTMGSARRSGKTFLVKHMLKSGLDKNYDFVIIMSPSVNLTHDFDEFVHNEKYYLWDEKNRSDLDSLIRRQIKVKKDVVLHQRADKKYPKRAPRLLLFIDDCIDSNLHSFTGVCDKIAERGRHFNVTMIIAAQRHSAISRSIRINSDYYLTFKPFNYSEARRFVDEFVPEHMRRGFIEFMESLFQEYEEHHPFIFIDNVVNVNERIRISNAQHFVEGEYDIIYIENDVIVYENTIF